MSTVGTHLKHPVILDDTRPENLVLCDKLCKWSAPVFAGRAAGCCAPYDGIIRTWMPNCESTRLLIVAKSDH